MGPQKVYSKQQVVLGGRTGPKIWKAASRLGEKVDIVHACHARWLDGLQNIN